MTTELRSGEWAFLSPSERIERCKLLGREAQETAARHTGAVKAQYLDLAQQWLQLAREMESDLSSELSRITKRTP